MATDRDPDTPNRGTASGEGEAAPSEGRGVVSLDLVILVGYVAATDILVSLDIPSLDPVRIAIALPFVLLVPGYALVAALFPRGSSGDGSVRPSGEKPARGSNQSRSGVDGVERVAFAFLGSVVLVILVGIALNATPGGFRTVPVVGTLTGLTVGLAAIGQYRRAVIPPAERVAVPVRRWASGAGTTLVTPESAVDLALNVAVVLTLLLAVGSVAYAGSVSNDGFTEFYVMAQNDQGNFVVGEYPETVTRDSTVPFRLGVGNHEGEALNYTAVVRLDTVRETDSGTTVTRSQQLGSVSRRVGANESVTLPVTVSPSTTGERLRLSFLLYRGDVSDSASAEAAYRETHLWITVREP